MSKASCVLAAVLGVTISAPVDVAAFNQVFTYQGEIEKDGNPFNGLCEFRFGIFDAPSGGAQSGSTQTESTTVNQGLFSVLVNANNAFDGTTRYLQIAARCPSGSGSFVDLDPRQQLTATPYSFYASDAGEAGGLDCIGCVGSSELGSGSVTDQKIANGISYGKLSGAPLSLPPSGPASGGLTGSYPGPAIANDAVSTLQLVDGSVTSDKIAVGSVDTDQLAVSSVTTAIIEDGTIVQSDLSFTPGTVLSVAAGSGLNGGTITQSGTISVRFGTSPESAARGDHAHEGVFWKVGGNIGINPSTDFLGTLDPQGLELRTAGVRSLLLDPTGDTINLLAGSSANSATSGVVGATISGGGNTSSPNQARSEYATISGGRGNQAWMDGVVGGGRDNQATGVGGTVSGGLLNEAMGAQSAVGGGSNNLTVGELATIGGGSDNQAGGLYGVVGGGQDNVAMGDYATIGGGGRTDEMNPDSSNRVTDDYGTIGGGGDNTAGNDSGTFIDAVGATVSGGGSNTAGGPHSTVAGGFLNGALGDQASVGGGTINLASGPQSTIPGGLLNSAEAALTFAAGGNAHATHPGAFVWSDGTNFTGSLAANTFNARASGGFRFIVNGTGDECTLSGSSGWVCAGGSDRAKKENVASVDGGEILARLAELPLQTWSYTSDSQEIRHIGPMAQDFHEAFQVGANDRTIRTIDADGVALAAIQELHRIAQRQELEIRALRDRNAALELRLVTLEQRRPRPAIGEAVLVNDGNTDRRSGARSDCSGSFQ